MLKDRSTYEIITPESVGLSHSAKLVLGKHSGRHAFKARLAELGFTLTDDEIETAFVKFKELADQKKEIYDEDLEAIVSTELTSAPEVFSLVSIDIKSGTDVRPSATVTLNVRGTEQTTTRSGDGPVDSAYMAIAELTGTESTLMKFDVKSVTGGMDALGEVIVTLEQGDNTVRGHGAHTDILVAAAQAYINALNKLEVK